MHKLRGKGIWRRTSDCIDYADVQDKEYPILTRNSLLVCFELALFGWKEGAARRFL
jgi:hypothetical protein